MSTSLTLPAENRSIPATVWSTQITKQAREKADWLKGLCAKCAELPQRGRKAGYQRIAASTGGLISAHTLEDVYHRYQAEGEWALIDRRKLRKSGSQASVLHESTVQYWAAEAEDSPHREGPDGTVTFESTWRKLIRDIQAGEVIPGLGREGAAGTWRELHMRLHPGKPLPKNCPWSLENLPRGHSLQNFRLRQPDRGESDAAIQGTKKLELMLPQRHTDTAKMGIMEVIQIDDKELDMAVWVKNPYRGGKLELVTVNVLLFMDVGTRRILSVRYYLAFTRPDGTRVGIERRDVQHGIAEILARIGYPVGWDLVICCENATAAITQAFQEALGRVSDGHIKVWRTSMYKGAVKPGDFSSTSGASWQKAHLESFNRRFSIELAGVRGQTGGNYLWKPAETAERLKQSNLVLRKVGELATEEEIGSLVEHDDLEAVQREVQQAIHEMETNPLHTMEGFKEVMQWRNHADDIWRPMNDPLLKAMREQHGQAYVNTFVQQDGHSTCARETVQQKWNRLYRKDDFQRLPMTSLAFLFLDIVEGKWTRINELTGKLSQGRVYIFRGTDHTAEHGQKVTLHFDAECPSQGCVILSEDGLVLGKMALYESGDWGDFAERAAIVEQKKKARNQVLQNLGKRHGTKARMDAKEARVDEHIEIVGRLAERTGIVAQESTAAHAVMTAFDEDETPTVRLRPALSRPRRALPAPVVTHDLDALRAERSLIAEQTASKRPAFKWASK